MKGVFIINNFILLSLLPVVDQVLININPFPIFLAIGDPRDRFVMPLTYRAIASQHQRHLPRFPPRTCLLDRVWQNL